MLRHHHNCRNNWTVRKRIFSFNFPIMYTFKVILSSIHWYQSFELFVRLETGQNLSSNLFFSLEAGITSLHHWAAGTSKSIMGTRFVFLPLAPISLDPRKCAGRTCLSFWEANPFVNYWKSQTWSPKCAWTSWVSFEAPAPNCPSNEQDVRLFFSYFCFFDTSRRPVTTVWTLPDCHCNWTWYQIRKCCMYLHIVNLMLWVSLGSRVHDRDLAFWTKRSAVLESERCLVDNIIFLVQGKGQISFIMWAPVEHAMFRQLK